ncbi:CAP domain-containing protein [Pseudogemmobacter humi]|uniref:Cysteine-rich secretory protein family protein n=1 Tax=Pseudogemmobacter humi TaxID=2483812 RepID=A0A3P5X225_9RHOB|nr:CAP domain-containing protein [Pseudogemmobacter humi]VDC21264.1 Cysteine-rich secretory protein family protein [Pseudogemmobacter humi]
MQKSFLSCAVAALGLALAFPALACERPAQRQTIHAEFTSWVNDLRASRGLKPLRPSASLEKAATAHACDMAGRNFMGHRGSDGSTLKTRLRSVGYGLSTATENVARSSQPPSSATAARLWSNSPGHLVNLLNPQITEMGLAVIEGEGGSYYVFVGAKPRG